MTLPNYLTLTRILLVPILVVILMTRVPYHETIGAVVFWIASLTDFFDGHLARKWKQITVLGKLLDPLADKLLVAGALISLVELGLTPAWMTFLILAREMAVTGLRGLASEEGITIAADRLGKWKLGAQVAAISCLIYGPVLDHALHEWTGIGVFGRWGLGERFRGALPFHGSWGFFTGMGQILMWVSLALAILSAVFYFRRFWKAIGSRILSGQGRLSTEGDAPREDGREQS